MILPLYLSVSSRVCASVQELKSIGAIMPSEPVGKLYLRSKNTFSTDHLTSCCTLQPTSREK